MISGLGDSYMKATEVTPEMREKIEENARNSTIKLTGSDEEIRLSKLVEGHCKVSPIKSVCLLVKNFIYCISDCHCIKFVTRFGKIDHIVTTSEIH